MAEPYPVELRMRVVDAYLSGEGSYAAVGAIYKVGEASVKRWVKLFERTGRVDATPKGGGRVSDVDTAEIEAIVARLGDANAGEITAEYNRRRRGEARRHVSSIKRALYRAGFVVKKNESDRWSSSGPMSPQSAKRSRGSSVVSLSKSSYSSTNLDSTSR